MILCMWQAIEMLERVRRTQCCEVAKRMEGQLKWVQTGEGQRMGERQTQGEMSIPHVTSRGTKGESQLPPLWETLQEGNLILRRQPQPPQVNMFFFFFSFLSTSPLIFSLTFSSSQSLCSNQHFNYYSISRSKTAAELDWATCCMPFRVSFWVLLYDW